MREREYCDSLRIRKLTPKELLFYIMGLCGIIDNIGEQLYEERFREVLPILWQEIGKKEIWQEIRRFWGVQQKEILQPRLYEQSIYKNWELQSKEQTGTQYFKNNCQENFITTECLFDLWQKWKNRYSPYRWELSQQQFEQFNGFMSQLSYKTTQDKKEMYYLWEACQSTSILQQTLFKIQKIWESVMCKEQDNSRIRIRKLTPLTCLRLMGFDDSDYQAMVDAGLSDSAIYHCAGDSIVVNVLYYIFKELV